jgi:hypothetical protein
MMNSSRLITQGAPVVLLALLGGPLACGGADAPRQDPQAPITAEIQRSSAALQNASEDTRKENQPVLARAEEDLRAGRRHLALQRLVNVRENLALAAFEKGIPAAQAKDMASFEAEWTRQGSTLREEPGASSASRFEGVPAVARGLGEAALLESRGYYDASLSYGRATTAEAGFYYLGAARAQREVADFLQTLAASSPRPAPPVRELGPELDALETEMLAVYRPPVSIDRHGEFIVASSSLKEAREMDAAGLRYGALLRYLQAAQQFAPLRQNAPALEAGAVTGRLREMETRLSAGEVDHSLGQLFLELAQAEAPGSGATAAIIASDVLPRYFAALEPARARPGAPQPASQVTVTLVRWPYT